MKWLIRIAIAATAIVLMLVGSVVFAPAPSAAQIITDAQAVSGFSNIALNGGATISVAKSQPAPAPAPQNTQKVAVGKQIQPANKTAQSPSSKSSVASAGANAGSQNYWACQQFSQGRAELCPDDSADFYVPADNWIGFWVYQPGSLKVILYHDERLTNPFSIWGPRETIELFKYESGMRDAKQPRTGGSATCPAWEKVLFRDCDSKWDGGDRFSRGWWYVRLYNHSTIPLAYVRVSLIGTWYCDYCNK